MAGVYSKAGRNFNLGKPLNKDLRESIITEIIVIGGDIVTVVSGTASDGTLSAVSKQFSVSKSTVSKLWKTVKVTGSISPKKPPERVPLHHHDFIELQKRESQVFHMLQFVRDFSSTLTCPTFTPQQLATH